LVYLYSAIKMMHGPINLRNIWFFDLYCPHIESVFMFLALAHRQGHKVFWRWGHSQGRFLYLQ